MLKLVFAVMASTVVWCGFLAAAAEPEGSDAIPKSIHKLAAPKAEKAFSKAEDREQYIKGFAEGFKSGLISPKATVKFHSSKKHDPFVNGADDGRKEALSQPKEAPNQITLVDFGYTETTATGSVRLGFEQFEFRPLGKKETWWFSPLVDMKELSDAVRLGRDVATLSGFLSPEKKNGGYGHFGVYRREFVVTKIKAIKTAKDKGN